MLLIALIESCIKNFPEISWNYSDNEIISTKTSNADKINIDIYIDATTSMEGFATGNSTIYSQFLDQLEASALSAWKSADAKYFKFGEKVKPINRSEFLTAKNNLTFYRERGIFMKTYIDSVIKKTESERLSVVITDLFQDEGDVNTMVEKLKEQCFKRNVMVGILGVKSEFNGKVFDAPNFKMGFNLNTKERPFYALIFGNTNNMEILFEALKTKQFVKDNQLLLISNHILKSFDVSLIKTKDSKFVNKKASSKQNKNLFDFTMKEEGKNAKFDIEINLDRNLHCSDYSEKNIDLIVYKKSTIAHEGSGCSSPKITISDSVLTNDIKIENIQRNGNKLTATLILNNEDPIGNYSYLIYLKINQINGFQVPSWIKEFSTDNPIPNSPSASKTYNLEKLTSTLLVAKNSMAPIYITKFFINIYKR